MLSTHLRVLVGNRMLYTSISLTVLDGFVTLRFGSPVWRAWSGDTWSRGLVLMTIAMAATSIANLWVQAIAQLESKPEAYNVVLSRFLWQ